MIAFVVIEAMLLTYQTWVGWLLPSLYGPHHPFGIQASPTVASDVLIDRIRRRYQALVLAAGCAVTVTTIAITVTQRPATPALATGVTAAFAVLFLIGLYAYGQARSAMAVVARSVRDDEAASASVAAAHTATPLDWSSRRWAAAVVTVAAVTAAAGLVRYPHLPPTTATGWDAAGTAARFAPTSPDRVDGFVVLQVVVALMILVAVEYGRRAAYVGDTFVTADASAPVDRVFRLVLGAAVGVELLLSGGSLILWGLLPVTTGTITVLALAAMTAGVVIASRPLVSRVA